MFLIVSHIFLYIINFVKWTPVTSSAESASSTLSLTEEERDKQGTHELELHYSGELDLHQHVTCNKNPGHADFKPVRSLLDCPVNGRFERYSLLLQQFALRAAALTTKLKVQYVSSNRSKVKRRNRDMELSHLAGQRVTSYGSGCVTGIDAIGDEGSFPCPLENCPHSKEPRQVYGYIIITTAAHVVFDDDEAKETIVEFFDDDPKEKHVEKAHGVKVRLCSVDGDFCEFMCVTHSQSLFNKISWLCSLSIPFEPDFHMREETMLVRILRLFELIKMFHIPSRGNNSALKVILGYSQNASEELEPCLSEWQRLHSTAGSIEESVLFLNAAESVIGLAGLKDSVQSILHQVDANFPRDFCKEFCAKIDVETAVKRIALIGTFHVLLRPRSKGPALNNEDIYIFFSDVLNAVEDTDLQATGWYDGTFYDPSLKKYFENVFSQLKDYAVTGQGVRPVILAIIRWFKCALESPLSSINDRLDIMLKCQLITKLSPQVTDSASQIMDNCQRISNCLDQISRTLSLHFGDDYSRVPQSVSHSPDHGIKGKCRHLTQLWVASGVIPKDDDLLRAIIDLRQKNCHLIKKVSEIGKILSASHNSSPGISVENLRKSLVDTEEMFIGVTKCAFQGEKAFTKEVKNILQVPSDMFQQQINDFLLMHFSHPHGQSKQVTFGEHIACNTAEGHYKHIYTVPTCPGCSGGPVWLLPKGEDGQILWEQTYAVPHSGCYDSSTGNNLNHSSSWTFSPFSVSQGKTKFKSIVPKPQCFISSSSSRSMDSTTAETSKKKEWLLYLLRSVDRQLPSCMSMKDVIHFKKSHGSSARISNDDIVEDLLNLACQFKWR